MNILEVAKELGKDVNKVFESGKYKVYFKDFRFVCFSKITNLSELTFGFSALAKLADEDFHEVVNLDNVKLGDLIEVTTTTGTWKERVFIKAEGNVVCYLSEDKETVWRAIKSNCRLK